MASRKKCRPVSMVLRNKPGSKQFFVKQLKRKRHTDEAEPACSCVFVYRDSAQFFPLYCAWQPVTPFPTPIHLTAEATQRAAEKGELDHANGARVSEFNLCVSLRLSLRLEFCCESEWLSSNPIDCLVRQPIQRLHRQGNVPFLRVFDLVVRNASKALHEQHYRRHARPADLGGIMQRTAG